MSAEPDRVVIIDPAFLGDVVFDGPLVAAVHERWPACEVGLVVRPPAEAIAERIAGVTSVHSFDKRGADRGFGGLMRAARELAAHRYDQALIPHPSIRSSLLARVARIPIRIGWRGTMASPFLTKRIAVAAEAGFVERRLQLLAADSPTALSGTLRRRSAQAPSLGRRIGLVLGSAWATKRWTPAQAAQFIAELERADVELVFIGADWERQLFDAVRTSNNAAVFDRAEVRIGGGVSGMLDALESCDVVVASDTGPMHAARALGIPVVAIFGPTSEDVHSFAAHDRIITRPVDCRPCSPHGHERCPLGHHACMAELDGGDVARAALEVLQ